MLKDSKMEVITQEEITEKGVRKETVVSDTVQYCIRGYNEEMWTTLNSSSQVGANCSIRI